LEWNVLGKDRAWEWGVTSLLSWATIKHGVCSYSFGSKLAQGLYNPRLYARISLSIQNRFGSKHALALWENCLDYLNERKNYGETPIMTIEKFRQLMGVSDDQYPAFKTLSRYVIKDPLEEINDKTDFCVTADYIRKNRTVEAVKFRFRRVSPIFIEQSKQPALFDDHENDIPPLVNELRAVGIPLEAAWEIWEEGYNQVIARKHNPLDFDDYVREKIRLLQESKSGSLRNPTGFLIDAIRKDWTSTHKAAKVKNQRKRVLKKVAPPPEPEPATDSETNHIAGIIRQFPEVLETAFDPERLQQEQPFLLKQYRTDLREQSALWNFENHPALAAYAEAQFRDLFLSGRAFKEAKQADRR
jgi:hypothetical protein